MGDPSLLTVGPRMEAGKAKGHNVKAAELPTKKQRESVRADALRSLSLPLRVRSGRIARVRVRIPWHALRSEPMAIFIEDLVLEVMAAPRAQGEQAKLPDEPTALLIPNDSSDASGASTASYFSKVVGLIM